MNGFTLESLDYLMSIGKTGSRKDLAEKFGVSERTISTLIEFMNLNGADIKFCRRNKSFYYNNPGHFIFKAQFIPSDGKPK